MLLREALRTLRTHVDINHVLELIVKLFWD